jgi:beta-RFAP synthase
VIDPAGTPSASSRKVFVEAPGRLHFGVLDLGGTLGRRFGGIGTAAPIPPLLVSASLEPGKKIVVAGEDATRAREFARRYLRHHHIAGGVRLEVHRALPSHVGLGSGTQLGLAVARALAELHQHDTNVAALAEAVGRTKRSGVGMWVFDGGGLVVEGGRRSPATPAPLLARLPFPPSWRCVIAIPEGDGVSGDTEESAFDALPAPPAGDAERVAHRVLMALLPGLAEGDLDCFAAALNEIQRITGEWFAPAQGGVFSAASRPLIERLTSLGAKGVGQSSWGPAVYGIVDGDRIARAIVDEIGLGFADGGTVFAGPFRAEGAKTWTAG